jgi:MFS family permease
VTAPPPPPYGSEPYGTPPPPSYPPPPGYPAAGYPPSGYPSYPTPGQPAWGAPQEPAPPPPRELRRVVGLLVANLTLSLVLTVVTVLARHSIVDYQLDHRHITDPEQRAALRDGYIGAVIGRVIGNIVVSIVYAFLVRALLRGRRWAYRRVIWIGCAGIVGLLLIQATPYPPWMRVEALLQALVLAALVFSVLRPKVRAYFAPHLPGRNTRRFRG